jgi:hypothetical protein
MYYFYVEIEHVGRSFSPARTDLAVELLMPSINAIQLMPSINAVN